MSDSTDTDLLDLQTRLRADSDGAQRRALEGQLLTWRQSFKGELDAGVTRQRFETLTAVIDAVDAATEVVNTTWRHYHNPR
jgi:hypothetical protein